MTPEDLVTMRFEFNIKETLTLGWIEHALMCAKYAKDIEECHEALKVASREMGNLYESIADKCFLRRIP